MRSGEDAQTRKQDGRREMRARNVELATPAYTVFILLLLVLLLLLLLLPLLLLLFVRGETLTLHP